MTLANFIGVDCSTPSPSSGTNQRAFLSTNGAAYARAGDRRSSYCQLISVFLPKRARMPMASAPGLCRCARQCESQNHKHQYYDEKFFHAVPQLRIQIVLMKLLAQLVLRGRSAS
jgi:hypothetical protein